jgi:L-amino acid N-acyltransferase YncA
VKPNFPGRSSRVFRRSRDWIDTRACRCSHVCNGGFLVAVKRRGKGVGRLFVGVLVAAARKSRQFRLLGKAFQSIGRDLGYKASFFNLVFVTNTASIKLWDSIGFLRTGLVPGAGTLKGHEQLVDAAQYYCDLTNIKHSTNEIFAS